MRQLPIWCADNSCSPYLGYTPRLRSCAMNASSVAARASGAASGSKRTSQLRQLLGSKMRHAPAAASARTASSMPCRWTQGGVICTTSHECRYRARKTQVACDIITAGQQGVGMAWTCGQEAYTATQDCSRRSPAPASLLRERPSTSCQQCSQPLTSNRCFSVVLSSQ